MIRLVSSFYIVLISLLVVVLFFKIIKNNQKIKYHKIHSNQTVTDQFSKDHIKQNTSGDLKYFIIFYLIL